MRGGDIPSAVAEQRVFLADRTNTSAGCAFSTPRTSPNASRPHTPPKTGAIFSSELRTSPVKLKPRKFLQKYLFLKSLHVLPVTPVRDGGEEPNASHFRRTAIVRTKTREEPISLTGKETPQTSPSASVILGAAIPGVLHSHPEVCSPLSEALVSPRVSWEVFSTHPTNPRGLSGKLLEDGSIRDISAIAAEDVQVGFAPKASARPTPCAGAMASSNKKDNTNNHSKKGVRTTVQVLEESNVLLLAHEHFLGTLLSKHVSDVCVAVLEDTMRQTQQHTPQRSLILDHTYHWILSRGTISTESDSHETYSHLGKVLTRYFDKMMEMHQTQILHALFEHLYHAMVAIPALTMLEYYGRRLLCMRRDMGIRSMIELYVLTCPGVRTREGSNFAKGILRKQGVREKRENARCPSTQRRSYSNRIREKRRQIILQGKMRHTNTQAKDNVREKSDQGIRRCSPHGMNRLCSATALGIKDGATSSVVVPLRSREIVLPVHRERTPPPRPKDHELMDIMRLKR